MDLITVALIAVGLAMDCFAVSIGVGATPYSNPRRSKLRLAFHFGIFQGLMTVLGWLAGSTIAQYIAQIDHWIALALLGYVGINMIRSGLGSGSDVYSRDPSRGRTMVMLSVATSIDAMAIGLSVAMLKVQVIYPSILIGLITFALSILGLFIGNRLGDRFGKRMEIVGGVILIGIGLRVVMSHLLS
jgi:putative Mn2+ efflux pump MntP